jgi:hypothetical protein
MDASQLWYPKILHSDPKYEFCTFYVSKVSEMLRNTSKHHFGSNGLEWMLYNFGTPKYCIYDQNTSFASFYVLKVSEMFWNTPKHHFGSNGLEWMLHNSGTPKYCIGPVTRVFLLLPAEGLRNAPKHFQTSFWVQWTRMDASQLWYPEIVHLGPKHKFCIFLRVEG